MARLFSFLTFIVLFSSPAFAHHPLDGITPDSFALGLLSGIAHPIIGLDHFAFVIAVGIAATLLASRFLLPLFFVGATLLGTFIHLLSFSLLGVELFISLSLVVVGGMIVLARNFSATLFSVLFVFFGVFHGFAYGEGIFGAEPTPLIAYLIGFGLIQYLVCVLSGMIIVSTIGKSAIWSANLPARFVAAMVVGAGGLLVGEHLLTFVGLAG